MPLLFAPWLCVVHCSGGMRAPLQYWPWTGADAGTTFGLATSELMPARLTASLRIEFFAVSAIATELLVSPAFGWMPPPVNTTVGALV